MASWIVCGTCGAITADQDSHTAWHRAIDSILPPPANTSSTDEETP